MDLCLDVAIICIFVGIVWGEQKTEVSSFTRQSREPPVTVKEGIKVTLTCQKIDETVFINFASIYAREDDLDITVIDSSKMTDISNKYGFNETDDDMYAFTINNVSREDEGTYRCIQGFGRDVRTRVLEIIYSPSDDSPQCSSNYKFPVMYYDEIKDDFEFNCSSERGKPPVLTKIYVNKELVTSGLEIINETRKDKEFTTYSLSQKFNETLQDSVFVCNITQQLPSRYNYVYHGSCSFGPLHFLSGFSLSLSSSNITSEGDNITLTCTSNMTGVEITWIIDIPSDMYIVTNFNQSVTILPFQLETSVVINIQCKGSDGNRTITANTTLFLPVVNNEEADDEKKNNLPLLVIFVVSTFIAVLSVLVCIFGWHIRKTKNVTKKTSTSNHIERFTPTNETNVNNGNNTALSGGDDGMIDNEIYEPASYSKQGTAIFGLAPLVQIKTSFGAEDSKIESPVGMGPSYPIGSYSLGEDQLVRENEIYQSFSYEKK